MSIEVRNWVLDNCFSKSGRELLPDSCIIAKDAQLVIINATEFFDDEVNIKTRCYYILNGDFTFRKCSVCGGVIKENYLSIFCSPRCRGKYVSSNEIIKNKKRESCLVKYGSTTPFHSNDIQEKIKKSIGLKYGVDNISSVDFIKEKKAKSYSETYKNNKDITLNNYKEKHKSILDCWSETKSIEIISKTFNVSFHHVYKILEKFDIKFNQINTSSYETELGLFLETLGINFIRNDRNTIKPKELDIIAGNKAIEINGIYSHSECSGHKSSEYHLNKTNSCEEKGLQLFHIFDNEWNSKKEIWKSVIKNSFGLCDKKIGARETSIKNISPKDAYVFCENNHLQGGTNTRINYGLFFEEELVSVMTFSKARYGKYDFELQRFCSKLGYQIYGGASKLLKAFISCHSGTIVSYANRRWSEGKLYEKLGFDFMKNTSPNYFYHKRGDLESRIKFQKHKLKGLLENFNSSLSEWENMKLNGYDRIWDCGNKVYTKRI